MYAIPNSFAKLSNSSKCPRYETSALYFRCAVRRRGTPCSRCPVRSVRLSQGRTAGWRQSCFPSESQPQHWLFHFHLITPSKPFMSSGVLVDLWISVISIIYQQLIMTLRLYADLIFIRVNIYPGPGEGLVGLLIISEPIYFIRVTIYPAALPHNTAEVTI